MLVTGVEYDEAQKDMEKDDLEEVQVIATFV